MYEVSSEADRTVSGTDKCNNKGETGQKGSP